MIIEFQVDCTRLLQFYIRLSVTLKIIIVTSPPFFGELIKGNTSIIITMVALGSLIILMPYC